MDFTTMIQGLRTEVSKFGATFADAKRRHPALQAVLDPEHAAKLLGADAALRGQARQDLVNAMIAEASGDPCRLWTGLLILAFEPMLRNLATSFGRKRAEDVGERVIFAFLAAVEKLPSLRDVEGGTTFLKLSTERALVKQAKKGKRQEREVAYDDECALWYRQGGHADSRMAAVVDAKRVLQALEASGPSGVLIAETVIGGESLKAHTARVENDVDPWDAKRTYDRVQKQRYRAMKRIRERLVA